MERLRKAAFVALLFAEITVQYVDLPALQMLLGPIALTCWTLAIVPADRTSRRISLALVAIGLVLFATHGAPLPRVIGSFAENTSVLMVMTLIPLVGVAVDLGGYAEALAVASRSVTSPRSLYILSTLLAFAIGSVLLNAAIALLWVVLFPVVERQVRDPRWFLVKSLPRGYDASLMWTPASPSTAVALSVSGAAWTSIAVPGIAVSLVVVALSIAFEWRYLTGLQGSASSGAAVACPAGAAPAVAESRVPLDTATKRQLTGLSVGLLSFIASIVAMQSYGFTIYQAVLPCVLGTVLVWAALLRRIPDGLRGMVHRLDESVSRMSTQFLLMTTAGFIGTAVKSATAGGLPGYLGALSGSKFLFTLAVSGAVALLSIVCVHPQIGMVITYSLVASVASSFSPAYVCLALLLGAALGFNLSPVSATMLVTSACAHTNSIEVGLRRHWKYALVVLPVGALLLSVLVHA